MTWIFQASSSLEQIELILPYGLQSNGFLMMIDSKKIIKYNPIDICIFLLSILIAINRNDSLVIILKQKINGY